MYDKIHYKLNNNKLKKKKKKKNVKPDHIVPMLKPSKCFPSLFE